MASDPINPWLDADELKQLAESLMQGSPKPKKAIPQDAGFGDGFVGFAGSEKATTSPPPAIPTPTQTLARPSTPEAKPVSVPSATLAAQRPMPAIPAKQTLPPAPQAMEPPPAPAASLAPPAASQPVPSAPEPKPITIPPVIEVQTTPPSAATPLPPIEREPAAAPAPVSEPIIVPTRTEAAVGSPEQQCEEFAQEMHQQFGSSPLFILNRNGHTVFGKENHPQFQFIAQSLTKHAKRRGLPKGHIHIKVGPTQTLEIIPVDLPNGGWVVGTVVPQPLQPDEIEQWVRGLSKLSSSLIQL